MWRSYAVRVPPRQTVSDLKVPEMFGQLQTTTTARLDDHAPARDRLRATMGQANSRTWPGASGERLRRP
jgi:hypothetical protein